MSLCVTAVHYEGGSEHRHIVSVMWLNPDSGKAGVTLTAKMVTWVQTKGNTAFVGGPNGSVALSWAKAEPPYLRTVADGIATDNLLSLPKDKIKDAAAAGLVVGAAGVWSLWSKLAS